MASGTEVVARTIECGDHLLVGDIVAWQPVKTVEPQIRVDSGERSADRVLCDS